MSSGHLGYRGLAQEEESTLNFLKNQNVQNQIFRGKYGSEMHSITQSSNFNGVALFMQNNESVDSQGIHQGLGIMQNKKGAIKGIPISEDNFWTNQNNSRQLAYQAQTDKNNIKRNENIANHVDIGSLMNLPNKSFDNIGA